jgi:hypothetical protein
MPINILDVDSMKAVNIYISKQFKNIKKFNFFQKQPQLKSTNNTNWKICN